MSNATCKPGDIVNWYPQLQRTEPMSAYVTAVGLGAINVLVMAPNARGGQPMDGIRHIDDPASKMQLGNAGFWGHIPGGAVERLNKIEAALKEMGIELPE